MCAPNYHTIIRSTCSGAWYCSVGSRMNFVPSTVKYARNAIVSYLIKCKQVSSETKSTIVCERNGPLPVNSRVNECFSPNGMDPVFSMRSWCWAWQWGLTSLVVPAQVSYSSSRNAMARVLQSVHFLFLPSNPLANKHIKVTTNVMLRPSEIEIRQRKRYSWNCPK